MPPHEPLQGYRRHLNRNLPFRRGLRWREWVLALFLRVEDHERRSSTAVFVLVIADGRRA